MVKASALGKDLQAGPLSLFGIRYVYHYAPLHYLLFIARAQALYSKDELRRQGYALSHFRSTSRRADELRGFSDYVHLCLDPRPGILQAKLNAGFPHFELRIPAGHIEHQEFHLCCYNIAKSRNPKYGKQPAPEGLASGRYYGQKQLPTAETPLECEALLAANLGRSMIEVLVPGSVPLPSHTELVFFRSEDLTSAGTVLQSVGCDWQVSVDSGLTYTANAAYAREVTRFLDRTRIEPTWLGDGLNFDLFRNR